MRIALGRGVAAAAAVVVVLLYISTTTAITINVNTETGPVRGFYSNRVFSFLGIPYASPPIGEYRWRVPQAAVPWTTPRNATSYSPVCPQTSYDSYTFPPGIKLSEDCLYLNIWSPNTTGLKPVMVWIHEGSLQRGGNAEQRLKGDQFSLLGNVVVVNINYRLGILGWLGHSAFTTDDPNRQNIGNYGLADQQMALAWVQRNIANFGGNPSEVTIMGESAGGSSVCFHLVSPLSKGLFNKAIIESGACFVEVHSKTEIQQYANRFQADMNCAEGTTKVIECLRSLTTDTILKYQSINPFGSAVVNNYELLEHPYTSITNQRVNNVSALITGNVLNEGSVFILLKRPVSKESYKSYIYTIFSSYAPLVLEQYPCENYNASDCYYAAAEVLGDIELICPNFVIANAFASQIPTYTYVFTHSPFWSNNLFPGYGAFHTAEIPFVFSTLAFLFPHTPDEEALSTKMSTYWTNFGTTNDPNGIGLGIWPRYTGWGSYRLVLDVSTNRTTTDYKQVECKFWQSLYPLIYNY